MIPDEQISEDEFEKVDVPEEQQEYVDSLTDGKQGWFKRATAKLQNTIAGQTTAGKVGGRLKDIATRVGVLPGWINETTDQIGDSLKSQQKENDMYWITNRLQEKSTWRGIVTALTALGVTLNPEQTGAIVTLGVALAGAFEVFFKEPQSNDAK